MKEQEIQDCIDQIKLLIPASDQSHFNANGRSSDGGNGDGAMTLDDLWDMYEEIEKAGLDDKSEEGQNLRTSIKEFIEDNDLDVRISRTRTNADLLGDIQDALEEAEKKDGEKKDEDEPEDAPAAEPQDEPEDDVPAAAPASRRTTRNDDTNEPAAPARAERRAARPIRRR